MWGAVFAIPESELAGLDDVERAEARSRSNADVIDRKGRRHRVELHRATAIRGPELPPAKGYLVRMLAGSRYWDLPAGWIVALDDRLDVAT